MCLSVCFSKEYLKNQFARITMLDIEMIHHESWKSSYFGVRVMQHKNLAGVGHETPVSVGF